MTIATISAFNYGHTIDISNQYLSFDEGSGELIAEIEVGSYTLNQFINQIALAMNEIGSQVYTVSVDRVTNLITISSTGNFDLLVSTGSTASQSAYGLIGFTGSDLTGLNSYTGDTASGDQYILQFPIQKFIDFNHRKKTINSKINKSGTGVLEVVSYGRVKYMKGNIMYITDIVNQGLIRNNASGVQDFLDFIDYATEKKPIEFIYDIDNPTNFVQCVLESTPDSREGTDYTLKEMYSQGLAYYFESGDLEFSELIE